MAAWCGCGSTDDGPGAAADDTMNVAASVVLGLVFVMGCVASALAASGELARGRSAGMALFVLIAAYVPYAAVGSVLVSRRPRNPIGWVLLAMGWTFAVSFLPVQASAYELRTLTAPPLPEAIAWLTELSVPLTFALFAQLAFMFPTGRLPEGRWRRPAALVLGLMWALVAIAAFWPVLTVEPAGTVGIVEIPNPFGVLPPRVLDVALPAQWMAPVVFPFILVASIAAIAGRYRASRGLERLQMRWLVAAFGAIAIAVPAGLLISAVFDPQAEVAWVPASLGFLLPPIAIGIAVTRYRLYEIDRLISRGVSWAVLSGSLVGLYAGAILLLQGMLGDLIQGQTVAVAVSTLLAAAAFQPLRRRIQAVVDHRFNRARYDAERTAAAFAERLRNEIDLATLNDDLIGVVNTALRPTTIAVWIRRSRPANP
jgi:hypothetical protein